MTINSEAGNGARIQRGLNTQAVEGADSEDTRALALNNQSELYRELRAISENTVQPRLAGGSAPNNAEARRPLFSGVRNVAKVILRMEPLSLHLDCPIKWPARGPRLASDDFVNVAVGSTIMAAALAAIVGKQSWDVVADTVEGKGLFNAISQNSKEGLKYGLATLAVGLLYGDIVGKLFNIAIESPKYLLDIPYFLASQMTFPRWDPNLPYVWECHMENQLIGMAATYLACAGVVGKEAYDIVADTFHGHGVINAVTENLKDLVVYGLGTGVAGLALSPVIGLCIHSVWRCVSLVPRCTPSFQLGGRPS